MFKFFIKISLVLVLFSSTLMAQNKEENTAKTDTIVYKQKYGLRLGADLSKLARTALDDNYTGFELVGDYRLTKRLYIAGEIGTEERTLSNEVLNNTTTGSYFKAGIDLNFYQNWLDMENMIFAGFRVGASTFSHKLNNYTIYNVNNQYWNNEFSIAEGSEFNNLNALWAELQIGFKAQLLNNLFAGINVQLKTLLTETGSNNYENLYIPGFNRTYDSSAFGTGYGFTLSYLIPIFKKDKIVVQETEDKK